MNKCIQQQFMELDNEKKISIGYKYLPVYTRLNIPKPNYLPYNFYPDE